MKRWLLGVVFLTSLVAAVGSGPNTVSFIQTTLSVNQEKASSSGQAELNGTSTLSVTEDSFIRLSTVVRVLEHALREPKKKDPHLVALFYCMQDAGVRSADTILLMSKRGSAVRDACKEGTSALCAKAVRSFADDMLRWVPEVPKLPAQCFSPLQDCGSAGFFPAEGPEAAALVMRALTTISSSCVKKKASSAATSLDVPAGGLSFCNSNAHAGGATALNLAQQIFSIKVDADFEVTGSDQEQGCTDELGKLIGALPSAFRAACQFSKCGGPEQPTTG